MPLLEKLVIGPSPLLKEVPSGIYHLKSLKTLEAINLSKEVVCRMQPDEEIIHEMEKQSVLHSFQEITESTSIQEQVADNTKEKEGRKEGTKMMSFDMKWNNELQSAGIHVYVPILLKQWGQEVFKMILFHN
nr:hypothetical protein CFP56_57243 [Quercus suber]